MKLRSELCQAYKEYGLQCAKKPGHEGNHSNVSENGSIRLSVDLPLKPKTRRKSR